MLELLIELIERNLDEVLIRLIAEIHMLLPALPITDVHCVNTVFNAVVGDESNCFVEVIEADYVLPEDETNTPFEEYLNGDE